MKKENLLFILSMMFLALVLVFMTTGCTASQTKEPAPARSQPRYVTNTPVPDLLGREKLNAYTSTFVIDFDGPVKWKYQLQTRKAPGMEETSLHIEGVEGAQNPGDILMVTDGKTTWMKGPGTDNECVQYPNNQGMDPTLVYPESLIAINNLPKVAEYVRDEEFSGRSSAYYLGGPLDLGAWKNASVEYHQEKDSGALLQFALLASGEDLLFNTGSGTMMATYSVNSFDTPTIAPVSGCEIDAPLPDSASSVVRLPGMASFDSSEGLDALRAFYQQRLPQEGWTESAAPEQSSDAIVLSYQRNAESVQVHLQAGNAGGSQVKLLFETNQ